MDGRRRWIALVLTMTAAAACSVVAGDRRDRWFYDEAWMLQVLDRVLGGEVLYRDVSFGVTPLSVYLLQAVGAFTGAEAWLLRALNALCMLAMAALAVCIARRLGASQAMAGAVAISIAAWMRPWPSANYSYLAQLFLMAAGAAILESRPVLAGSFAGLAFAAKQNVGLLALLFVLSFHRRQWWKPAGAFLLMGALPLAPVIATGGGAGLLEFGFLGKTVYLGRAGTLPPVEGAVRMTQFAADRDWVTLLPALLKFAPFVFALAPLVLAFAGWREKPLRIAAALGIASLAGTAPRLDLDHVRVAVPACLCALACLMVRHVRSPRMAAACLAIPGIGFGLHEYGAPLAAIASGAMHPVDLPHYRFVYAAAPQIGEIREQSRQLREMASGRDLYLQSPRAGILYLLTGLRNRTPFDYPLVTTFGRDGQRRVIGDFESGHIACAWVETIESAQLAPIELVRYLNTSLAPNATVAGGTLYCR